MSRLLSSSGGACDALEMLNSEMCSLSAQVSQSGVVEVDHEVMEEILFVTSYLHLEIEASPWLIFLARILIRVVNTIAMQLWLGESCFLLITRA